MAEPQPEKDRMAKALGAAFLQHRVSQLEQDVDRLSFSRNDRRGGRHHHRGGRGNRGDGFGGRGEGGRGGRDGRGRGRGSGRPGYQYDYEAGKLPIELPGESICNSRSKKELQKRVVDVSALVWYLPVIKQWARDKVCQVIIPLDAISTLDQLKRAPPPLNHLSREATRYLEHLFQRHREATLDEKDNDRQRVGSPCIVAQGVNEELGWSEAEKYVSISDGGENPTVQELSESAQTFSKSPPSCSDAEDGRPNDEPSTLCVSPQTVLYRIRPYLQCAFFYFQRQDENEVQDSGPNGQNVVGVVASSTLPSFEDLGVSDKDKSRNGISRADGADSLSAEAGVTDRFQGLASGEELRRLSPHFSSTLPLIYLNPDDLNQAKLANLRHERAMATEREREHERSRSGFGRGGRGGRGDGFRGHEGGSDFEHRRRGRGHSGRGSGGGRTLFIP